ncbi:MAG: Maf family protein [Gammaproteobacteria bacterium]
MDRPLILASTSRYRALLLQRLGLPFSTEAPGTDETQTPGEAPADLVRRLAESKARAVARHHPEALVIGSDQVAACGALTLGKPGTAENAEAQLATLSGQTVTFYTGLCLVNSASGLCDIGLDTTRVVFRTLHADEIRAYVRREQPLDCAGAFKSEGLGIALFERIESQDPSGLIGLPLIMLCAQLRRAGVTIIG